MSPVTELGKQIRAGRNCRQGCGCSLTSDIPHQGRGVALETNAPPLDKGDSFCTLEGCPGGGMGWGREAISSDTCSTRERSTWAW